MPELILRTKDRTNPIIWLIAIICAVLAVAVIIAGLVVIIIYMIYQPKQPYIFVANAHLDKFDYDQSGLLGTQMTLNVIAENDNTKEYAIFTNLSMRLKFSGIVIAELRADPFGVERNGSVVLDYVVVSALVPLDEEAMEEMDGGLRTDMVRFNLEGQARTRWRVGMILWVRLWTHLSCELRFFVSNGSSTGFDCSLKSDWRTSDHTRLHHGRVLRRYVPGRVVCSLKITDWLMAFGPLDTS